MRKFFDLFLLRTGTRTYVSGLLSVCAVSNSAEVHVVRLIVLLERLFLVKRILPLRRTRNPLLSRLLRSAHPVFVLSLRRGVVLMLVSRKLFPV